jgi:hypothetical protein
VSEQRFSSIIWVMRLLLVRSILRQKVVAVVRRSACRSGTGEGDKGSEGDAGFATSNPLTHLVTRIPSRKSKEYYLGIFLS